MALIPILILLAFRGRVIAWPWESQGLGLNVFMKRLGCVIRYSSSVLFGAMIIVSLFFPLSLAVFALVRPYFSSNSESGRFVVVILDVSASGLSRFLGLSRFS